MSLTIIFLAVAFVFVSLAIGTWIFGYQDATNGEVNRLRCLLIGWVFAGLAAASFASVAWSLSYNQAETKQRCYDLGGQIYNNKCVEYVPQVKELMKL